jgi:flagellar protein FliJ
MSRPQPIESLIDLSRHRVDDATRKLQDTQAMKQKSEGKLLMLAEYRAQHVSQRREVVHGKVDIQSLKNAASFLDKLDNAMNQQQDEVSRMEQSVEKSQVAWHSEQRKLKSFETLHGRQVATQAANEARMEQKQIDEIALQQAIRRTA